MRTTIRQSVLRANALCIGVAGMDALTMGYVTTARHWTFVALNLSATLQLNPTAGERTLQRAR